MTPPTVCTGSGDAARQKAEREQRASGCSAVEAASTD